MAVPWSVWASKLKTDLACSGQFGREPLRWLGDRGSRSSEAHEAGLNGGHGHGRCCER